MFNYQKITNDIYYIGASDRRNPIFEGIYPIHHGMSYNSYFVDGDETLVLDTVDKSVFETYFQNIEELLKGRPLDYLIINHMEPDHSAMLHLLLQKYPEVKIICSSKAKDLVAQFCSNSNPDNFITVTEGQTMQIGSHSYTFVMAPMVHWPEVMLTYDTTEKILYSADAFGTFGALSGNIFYDEISLTETDISEYRRYYSNIVGKYGIQVKTLLKKAENLEIKMVLPLHGYLFRGSVKKIISLYAKWANYTAEDNAVLIAYASIYGNTANAADILATELSNLGLKVKMYDLSVTHFSYVISEIFRCSHIVLAAPTYNGSIFTKMETLLCEIKNHNIQNRTFACVENGSWGPLSAKIMKETISSLKNVNILENSVTIKSSVKDSTRENILTLAKEIFSSLEQNKNPNIEPSAIFKLSYGLFVLSANDGEKDNGCIVNTVTQVTDTPKRITVTVNNANLTHDMILKSGKFNVSVLSCDTPFEIFEKFGFVSGKQKDKFADISDKAVADNGILYLTKYANALISAEVISSRDLGTHTEFLAEVTEGKILSDTPSMTYQYYFDNVKPKPQKKKKGYVCKICGYVYEGETLPKDFVCPLCKHPASDFEPIE